MSLPTIFPPASLPTFRAAGHGIELGNDYAPVPRARGHSRLRPKSSGAPRIVPVMWTLTEEQAYDFDFWIEYSLNRATRHFTAKVANQGPGQLFWDAVWVREPRCDPQASPQGVIWTVSGQLLLTGEGEPTRPETGEFAAEIDVPLTGGASIYLPATPLAAEIVVALLPITTLRSEITVALLPTRLPLAAEIAVPLDGSAVFSAGGGGGTGSGTIFVGEEASSDLREVEGILFPDDTVSFDTDDFAHYTPRPIVMQATAPTNPYLGLGWLDTDIGVLFWYVYDGNSFQWVEL